LNFLRISAWRLLMHWGRFVMTLTLGLQPRWRHRKVQAKSASRESHLHSQEREGMNPHTPKWTPTLGVRILMELWIFKEIFQGSKLIVLKTSLYHWKTLETWMSKMGLHDPFEYLEHKLWQKKGRELKCQFDSHPQQI
jgi:hypothetical protein